MVSIVDVVSAQSVQRAQALAARSPIIRAEIAQLKAEIVLKEADLEMATTSLSRAEEFGKMVQEGPLCPSCWIDRAEKASLRPVGRAPEDDPRIDLFRCNKCNLKFEA
jgi:hypothetical protein